MESPSSQLNQYADTDTVLKEDIMIQEFTVADQQVLLRLSGRMYVEEAVQLRDSLSGYIEKGHRTFIIDLSDVDYIDSSGLGMLVAIHKKALQKGGSVIIKGINGLVKELFELTRLTQVFEIQ